jgi:uncharacterized protein (TIGR02145 family)
MRKLSLLIVQLILLVTIGYTQTVKIGTQVWMTKNLDVTKFQNGDPIPEAKTIDEWRIAGENQKPAWCYYNNDSSNGTKYGILYNWYAVTDKRLLAPEGWRIPVYNDFKNLLAVVKSTDKLLLSKDPKGFSMIYSGDRDVEGYFYNLNESGHLWTSDMNNIFNAKYFLFGPYDGYGMLSDDNRGAGFSVRCIKD